MEDLTNSISGVGDSPIAKRWCSELWCALWTIPSTTPGSRPRQIKVGIKTLMLRSAYGGTDRQVERVWKSLRRELTKRNQLIHQNVSPILGYTYGFGNFPAIVYPWYSYGNVREYLKTHRGANRTKLLIDVAAGLSYMHEQQPAVVHGNIKAINIYIKDNGEACLGDFGMSRIVQEVTRDHNASAPHVSYRWTAPELLENGGLFPRVTPASDVYAFGCLSIEIMTGQVPYHTIKDEAVVLAQVRRGMAPPHPPDGGKHGHSNLWSVIERCWETNPHDRPRIKYVAMQIVRNSTSPEPQEPLRRRIPRNSEDVRATRPPTSFIQLNSATLPYSRPASQRSSRKSSSEVVPQSQASSVRRYQSSTTTSFDLSDRYSTAPPGAIQLAQAPAPAPIPPPAPLPVPDPAPVRPARSARPMSSKSVKPLYLDKELPKKPTSSVGGRIKSLCSSVLRAFSNKGHSSKTASSPDSRTTSSTFVARDDTRRQTYHYSSPRPTTATAASTPSFGPALKRRTSHPGPERRARSTHWPRPQTMHTLAMKDGYM